MNRQDVIKILTSLNAVLIPLNGKAPPCVPNGKNYGNLTLMLWTRTANCNIGVVLGDPSDGIVDVDIDRVEALPLADFFLPQTEMVFGRKSKPRSHRIYKCPEPGRCKKGRGDYIGIFGRQRKWFSGVNPSLEATGFTNARNPGGPCNGKTKWRRCRIASQRWADDVSAVVTSLR